MFIRYASRVIKNFVNDSITHQRDEQISFVLNLNPVRSINYIYLRNSARTLFKRSVDTQIYLHFRNVEPACYTRLSGPTKLDETSNETNSEPPYRIPHAEKCRLRSYLLANALRSERLHASNWTGREWNCGKIDRNSTGRLMIRVCSIRVFFFFISKERFDCEVNNGVELIIFTDV